MTEKCSFLVNILIFLTYPPFQINALDTIGPGGRNSACQLFHGIACVEIGEWMRELLR
jgi:hypothetical protein